MAKILIIDDAQMSRDIQKIFLRRMGHQVIEATDGAEGISQFLLHNPDLVITDLNMPGISGIETLQKIKKNAPSAKVLICSAMQKYEIIQLAITHGALGYIIKPYQHANFIDKVTELLTIDVPVPRR